MSTEKAIKLQAKDKLNTNWFSIISAIFVVCVVFIMINVGISTFEYAFKVFDADTGNIVPKKRTTFMLIENAILFVMLLASPLINGVIKSACNIATTAKSEPTDVFYFFTNLKRYLKTVFINTFFACAYMLLGFGFDVYGWVSNIFDVSITNSLTYGLNESSLALIGAYILSVIIRIAIYFIFIHYPLMAYSMDNSKPVLKYLFGYIGFSFKHFWAVTKLTFSFIGWILLCFFVVPAMYVLPYMLVSYANSAKWLFEMEENRGVVC